MIEELGNSIPFDPNKYLADYLQNLGTVQDGARTEVHAFRDRLQAERQKLLTLSPSQRRAVMTEVSRIAVGSEGETLTKHYREQRTLQRIALMPLSHPNEEIFHALLRDDELFNAMSRYMYARVASTTRTGGGSLKTKRKKFKNLVFSDVRARVYVDRYSSLCIQKLKETHPYIMRGPKSNEITFYLDPGYDETRGKELLDETHRKVAERVVKDRRRDAHHGPRARLHSMMRKLLERDGPKGEERNDLLVTMDAIKFLYISGIAISGGEARPISALPYLLKSAESDSTWPLFSSKDETVPLRHISPGTIEYEVEKEMLPPPMNVEEWDKIHAGFSPLGFKVHMGQAGALGNLGMKLDTTPFKFRDMHHGGTSANFPAFGNISTAQMFFDLVKRDSSVDFWGDDRFRMQACFPHVLDVEHSAILGLIWYLTKSTFSPYSKDKLATTHNEQTGYRPLLFGMVLDEEGFERWGKNDDGTPRIIKGLFSQTKYANNRTDVIDVDSFDQVRDLHFVFGLLSGRQLGEFWEARGNEFVARIKDIINRYAIEDVFGVDWVYDQNRQWEEQLPAMGGKFVHLADQQTPDERFFGVLETLFTEAKAEVAAFQQTKQRKGMIFEIADLIEEFRGKVREDLAKIGNTDTI